MFQLYYTLNTNLEKKDINLTKKREILEAIKTMDILSKKAFFMLIYEHAITEGMDLSNYKIPYGGIEKTISTTSQLHFDLLKFPIPLRHILYKFIKVIQKNENIF